MSDVDHEHEVTEPPKAGEDERTRHASFGRPRSKIGPLIAAAGFETFAELAQALDVSSEYLSRLRH